MKTPLPFSFTPNYPAQARAFAGVSLIALLLLLGSGRADAQAPQLPAPPEPSGGSYQYQMSGVAPAKGSEPTELVSLGTSFLGFHFDDNATENAGSLFIPPDPCGAAGPDRLIAVVNTMIEIRNKTGGLIVRDSLKDFFSAAAGNLGTRTFDPKVIFDQHANRFVVVTLERLDDAGGLNPDPDNKSVILLAVSKTATPATLTSADWYYHVINAETSISAVDYWADYPGFEVDEEAVYITGSMFSHTVRAFGGVRLWIVNKGVAGGFYGGGAAAVTVHNPYAGGGIATTTMPAQIHGAAGAGAGIGTYLVSYSGLSGGGLESVQVVRVNNPLGAVTFSQQYVSVGNIEDTTATIADAPQLGTATLINIGDRRALDAVWQSNALWMVATIRPTNTVDAGQATTHWWKLNTTVPATITLSDQGNIGGEDIGVGVHTYYGSVALNKVGDAMIGFAASGPTNYGGAYAAGRQTGDAPGTVQPVVTVRAGEDYYIRTFGNGTGRNRWGDYSGLSVDPADGTTFWAFNEYARPRGTVDGNGHDGRWGTAWASLSFPPEISVSGNSVNLTDGDATPATADHTDFGSALVTGGTVVRTFTITNVGSSQLLLGTITVGGTHAADFTVTSAATSPVAVSSTTSFQITFNPGAAGLRSATLSFTNNDSNETPFDFAIQGTGTIPEIGVTGNSTAIADGDATPSAADHTDFGSTNLTGSTVVRTFTVTNSGTGALNLTGTPKVVVGGAHAANFTVTVPPASPVAASGFTTFQVTFDPGATGLRTATLSLDNDDSDEHPYNFSIQGTGRSLIASNATFARGRGLTLKIKVADIAVDQSSLPLAVQSLGASAQGATLTFDGTRLYYTPANDNNDSFTYTVTNGVETATGTITVTVVTSPGGLPKTIVVSGGTATIQFYGIPGYQYDVQRTTSLTEPVTWTTLNGTALTAGATGAFSFTDTNAPNGTAYYRSAQH